MPHCYYSYPCTLLERIPVGAHSLTHSLYTCRSAFWLNDGRWRQWEAYDCGQPRWVFQWHRPTCSFTSFAHSSSSRRCSLGHRPKPTPAWIASWYKPTQHGLLPDTKEVIRAVVGLGLGPRLQAMLQTLWPCSGLIPRQDLRISCVFL